MGVEIGKSQNWLEIWRKRKGLSPETVDKILAMPLGWTQKHETLGLVRTPMYLLTAFARIYEVPNLELHKAVIAESLRWRR